MVSWARDKVRACLSEHVRSSQQSTGTPYCAAMGMLLEYLAVNFSGLNVMGRLKARVRYSVRDVRDCGTPGSAYSTPLFVQYI